MDAALSRAADLRALDTALDPYPTTASGTSWGAIFAGAAGAAALSLILLVLGTGLGLSSVSPWVGRGVTSTTLGASTIVWLTFTQLAASGMGGYLAGRLRTKWMGVHTDEVYFRDTAHGFLAWAVATLAAAAMLTGAIGSALGTSAQVGATVAGGAAVSAGAAAGMTSDPSQRQSADAGMGYFVDTLFRKDSASTTTANPTAATSSSDASPAASSMEVGRIFASGIAAGSLPAEDVRYVGQLVAQRTGLSQADAEKRVTDNFAKVQTKLKEAEATARDAADKARKAAAYAALWLFVSLLVGAFVASLAATYGGRRRDL